MAALVERLAAAGAHHTAQQLVQAVIFRQPLCSARQLEEQLLIYRLAHGWRPLDDLDGGTLKVTTVTSILKAGMAQARMGARLDDERGAGRDPNALVYQPEQGRAAKNYDPPHLAKRWAASIQAQPEAEPAGGAAGSLLLPRFRLEAAVDNMIAIRAAAGPTERERQDVDPRIFKDVLRRNVDVQNVPAAVCLLSSEELADELDAQGSHLAALVLHSCGQAFKAMDASGEGLLLPCCPLAALLPARCCRPRCAD